VYAACVAALETHTLNLAAELAATGVTVNSQIDVDVIASAGPARTLLTQVLATESGHIGDTIHPDPVQ
jgi:enoyl-[acyl-carrier-protein] reductase (NADH)